LPFKNPCNPRLLIANRGPCPYPSEPPMKIALAQFNPTVGDFAGNSAKILELTQLAQQRGADLAVFSELCLCGLSSASRP